METMRLSDQITRIMKEQDYARTREDGFRKISEILNSRVLWWACVQVEITSALLLSNSTLGSSRGCGWSLASHAHEKFLHQEENLLKEYSSLIRKTIQSSL